MNTKILHASLFAILITSTTFFSVHAMERRRTLPPVITNMQLTAKEEALLNKRIADDRKADCMDCSLAVAALALTVYSGPVTGVQTCLGIYAGYNASAMTTRSTPFEAEPLLKKEFATHLQLSALLKKAQHAKSADEYDVIKEEAYRLYPEEFARAQSTIPTFKETCFYTAQRNPWMHFPGLDTIRRSIFWYPLLPSLQQQVNLFKGAFIDAMIDNIINPTE